MGRFGAVPLGLPPAVGPPLEKQFVIRNLYNNKSGLGVVSRCPPGQFPLWVRRGTTLSLKDSFPISSRRAAYGLPGPGGRRLMDHRLHGLRLAAHGWQPPSSGSPARRHGLRTTGPGGRHLRTIRSRGLRLAAYGWRAPSVWNIISNVFRIVPRLTRPPSPFR